MPSDATNPKPRSVWYFHLMALTTVLIWSFSFLHIIILNERIDPISVVALRKDIFAIGLIGMLFWRRPNLRNLSKRQWVLLAGMSILSGPLYHFTFAWSSGKDRISVALLGLIIATIPLHVGWLGWLFLREKLTLLKLFALALGLIGVLTVIYGQHGGIELIPETLAGPIGTTCAAMFAACGMILTRASRKTLAPIDLFLVSSTVVVVSAWLAHPWADFQSIAEMDLLGWWAALFLGTLGSGVAYFTWISALSGLQAVTVAMYMFLASVLAALWGWVFRGEELNWYFALGGGLVLMGLLLPALVNGRRTNNDKP